MPERGRAFGARFKERLVGLLAEVAPSVVVRGQGLMIGVDLGDVPGRASQLARALLERGYITSTGGGRREVLVLTPPLTIAERLLVGAADVIADAIRTLPA